MCIFREAKDRLCTMMSFRSSARIGTGKQKCACVPGERSIGTSAHAMVGGVGVLFSVMLHGYSDDGVVVISRAHLPEVSACKRVASARIVFVFVCRRGGGMTATHARSHVYGHSSKYGKCARPMRRACFRR